MPTAQILINLENLASNFRSIKEQSGSLPVFPVIKARGYGQGAFPIAQFLEKKFSIQELPYFCVARFEELKYLRKQGLRRPILVLSGLPEDLKNALPPENAAWVVSTRADLENCVSWPESWNRVKLHLNFNTGMNRLGLNPELLQVQEKRQDFINLLTELQKKGFEIDGVMSHLACAEQAPEVFSAQQTSTFDFCVSELKKIWSENKLGTFPRWIHLLNSEGVNQMGRSAEFLTAVRTGLHLWGVHENSKTQKRNSLLRPIAQVRGVLRQIHFLKEGDSIGYGRTFICDKPMQVATVSLGYADGLRRDAPDKKLNLYIHGEPVRFLGRISMDMCAVDLGERKDCKEGDWAYWICKEQSAEKIAEAWESISYEVLCACAERLEFKVEGGS